MHPLAHDPHRVYTDELMQEWINAAIKQGITNLTFTDHDRFYKGIDFDVFARAKEKAHGLGINLNIGIELDNDPESSVAGRAWTEKNYDRLSYILGSIHFIKDWAFDHPDFIADFEKWNIADLYEVYFGEIARIAADPIFDCYAHLDLIKIFKFFPERDVMPTIESALTIIKNNDKAIEINTAGWHKPVKEQYPKFDILKKAVEMKIPITISSDAHVPDHLGRSYPEAFAIIQSLGITEIAVWENHKRILIAL
jgi:histidinol-phosphatase (PHP family)